MTRPFPGAFSHMGDRKCLLWAVSEVAGDDGAKPGTVISVDPLVIACKTGAVLIETAQQANDVLMDGAQMAVQMGLVEGMRFGKRASDRILAARKKRVLILGVDGFIGNALSERLLEDGRYEVHGMDLHSKYVERLMGAPGFHFDEGDISIHREWIEYHIRKCDIVIPLVAIATPIEYTRNPLRVFELVF